MNRDFFEEVAAQETERLQKSMSAGGGTDSALFAGGRSLIYEDCENTLLDVMEESESSFKLMNTLPGVTAKSPVHEYATIGDGNDSDEFSFVGEGEASRDINADLKRKTRQMKYIQRMGNVTQQMIESDTIERAEAVETRAVTRKILRAAELAAFTGDSKVVPKQYDGLVTQVLDADAGEKNVVDARGKTVATLGDSGLFNDILQKIAEKGGEPSRAFFPIALVQDIQALAKSRILLTTGDKAMSPVFEDYPTAFGNLKIGGKTAGGDLLFKPKGAVVAAGDSSMRPNAPTIAVAIQASQAGSKFAAADAGAYVYEVHAINEYGISAASVAATGTTTAAGDGVEITITPSATGNAATGFVICRSAKNGSTTMEMVRIAKGSGATTVHMDLNENLPGTASMLFLTDMRERANVRFIKYLPMRKYLTDANGILAQRFIMALWGAPDIVAPKWCGVVNNIGYSGGLSF